MDIRLSSESLQVLVAFACYLVGIVVIGIVSHRFLSRGSFVKEYFVGNRGLGPWVLALSVAATAISGGSFMGFPSLIYTNGWIMGLWVCSYMVVPLTTMAFMGKRINQVARISGAVTVPDVLRDRFESPGLGILSTLLILLFLVFNLVAQFKAGGLVIQEALRLRAGAVDLGPVGQIEIGYLIGLGVFGVTVVAYTAYGGFMAVAWNDVLQGLVMLVGVLVMAILAVRAVPSITVERTATDATGNAVSTTEELHGLAAATERVRQQNPELVHGPGPKNFMPLGLAFSFYLMWSLMSPGQPSGMVRLMAFRDSKSVRSALLLVSGYYLLTYVSLLIIFICARAIYPTEFLGQMGGEGRPDQIMPAMVRTVAHPLVAGLLLAAPFAAIMSTVAAFLLMISSSLVRDLYQRTINPDVSHRAIKFASYLITSCVGVIVMIAALNPPEYLQYIIIFTGSGQGCCFLVPVALALYWRRATRAGIMASMVGAFVVLFGLYALGWIDAACRDSTDVNGVAYYLRSNLSWIPGWGQERLTGFSPLYVGNVDPLVWGLLASIVLGIGVSLRTRPDPEQVQRYFPLQ